MADCVGSEVVAVGVESGGIVADGVKAFPLVLQDRRKSW